MEFKAERLIAVIGAILLALACLGPSIALADSTVGNAWFGVMQNFETGSTTQNPEPTDVAGEEPQAEPSKPTRRYVTSLIGDSHAANNATRAALSERLNDPGAFGSAMAGPSDLRYHSLGGGRIAAVRDYVSDGGFGSREGADFVLLMAGTNDLVWLRNTGADVDSTIDRMVADFKDLVNKIDDLRFEGRPRIVVAATIPTTDARMNEWAMRFNERLLNELENVDLFLENLWYALWDESAGVARSDLMRDYIHPNDTGAFILGQEWFEGMKALFDGSIADSNPYIHKMPGYLK